MKAIRKFLSLILFTGFALAAAPAHADNTYMQAYPGWDAAGGDFDSFPSGNASSCAQACNERSNCTGSEFVGSTARCWLKNRIGAFTRLNGATLYLKGINARSGIDYPGGDYHHYAEDSWQGCSRACYNQSRCKAFTYVTQTRTCWLKDRIIDANFLDGAVSGRR